MSTGTIERTIDVPLAPPEVWARITDVREVASWLSILERVTERERLAAYDAVLQDRVGPFRLRADLAIKVTEATEPSILAVQAAGEDRQVRSRIAVDASLELNPGESGTGTRLHLVGSYEVTGRVATLGASTINAKARKLVDEFCTRVETELR
jgi:carbon monoxide dehydrogenase subunit G